MASLRQHYKGLAVLDLSVHQHHIEQAMSASTTHALHVKLKLEVVSVGIPISAE